MKKISLPVFYRQLLFVSILFLGGAYLSFLLLLSRQIFSGFIMQGILLTSAFSTSLHSFSTLIVQPKFIFNFISGLFWLTLLGRFFLAFVRLILRLRSTSGFIRSLSIKQTNPEYSIFFSTTPSAFTAGFFRPQIYLSTRLIEISTPSELFSIISHESSHLHHLDPLRELIASYIFDLLPPFPFKSWLLGQYQAVVEISCDLYSQSLSRHPDSLVSALIKVQEPHLSLEFISNFSAQSQRLQVLVGKKTQPLLSLLFVNFSIIALLMISSSYLYHTPVFDQCQHLLHCFQTIFVHTQHCH